MPDCQEQPHGVVNVYVDGFNLNHAISKLKDNRIKWLDLRKLSGTFLRRGAALGRVVFFTAVVTWDRSKEKRHREYLRALTSVGVDVVESNFRKQPKHCFQRGLRCLFREEKKTDVAIGVSMVADAAHGGVSRFILITADSDQVPTIETLRTRYPRLELTLVYPPKERKEATELGSFFRGRNRKELSAGLLHRCLLPRDILDSHGRRVATRPALYSTAISN